MAEILVVDDEPVMQMTVGRVFEQAGDAAVAAHARAKGLAMRFQAKAFDLLIPGIFMPGMDELETTHRIPRQRPDLAIIITSGLPRTPDSMQEPDDPIMATRPKRWAPCSSRSGRRLCSRWSPTVSPHRARPLRNPGPDRDAVSNS
ncbi:response regulator [Bradyrhizobium sp. STM 3557]|uniref:response regulator n=1 Tax=Bradyrhizobium sp. STM 3557 TaxID=578920 RepID=UPI00388D5E50